MLGVYFSGTGNTKHCVEKLTALLDKTVAAIPLESSNIIEQIKDNNTVIFGYPVQFSNVPYMVRDFIRKNCGLWSGKKILCVATMGAFSGDAQAAPRGFSESTAPWFWAEFILKCRIPCATASC